MPSKVVQTMAFEQKSLRQLLHEHIRYVEEERPPWRLHASDITRESPPFCPRYPVIARQYEMAPKKERVTTSMAVTYKWGRLVEKQVIDWFSEADILTGDWRCEHRGCKAFYEWQGRPKFCKECGGDIFSYVERRAVSAHSGASSGLDMLVNRGAPLLTFVECKSIDKDKFKDLVAPLAEHRVRTMLSLRNIEESADPKMKLVNNQLAVVLYVTKGGFGVKAPDMAKWDTYDGGFSPFKAYEIKRDDKLSQPYVEKSRASFLALKGEGPMPPRTCESKTCPRAQACHRRDHCFSIT